MLGADEQTLRTWDTAVQVDSLLAGFTATPADHPLAYVVPDKATTELLVWPLTGSVPPSLAETGARLDIGSGERETAAAELRTCAEQARGPGEREAMLRRQARFLLAPEYGWPEDNPLSVDVREWTPQWPLARSAAITASVNGDPEPLRRFIRDGLDSDEGMSANLRYWAYWVGEIPETWTGDSAMTGGNGGDWSGERLLGSLLHGVVHNPYRDLSAHTLWALLRSKRGLATHWHSRIAPAIQHALDTVPLDERARHRLEQVSYAMEVA